jgi:hypothetical protein
MPKNFSQIVESQSNIIRSMINGNKTDTLIINEKNLILYGRERIFC